MALLPKTAPWKDILTDTAGSLDIEAVSPGASLALLEQLNSLVFRAMSLPYAVTGLSCDTSNTTTINATAMVSGGVYKIVTLGNTNFLTYGAAAAEVGEVFVANGVGTGTGTVKTLWYWTQRVNAGCAYLRGKFAIGLNASLGDAELPQWRTLSTSSSMAATSAVIAGDIDGAGALPDWPPGNQPITSLSSEKYDGSPSATSNRPYEVHSLDPSGSNPSDDTPYTEGFAGCDIHGMSALWVGKDMSGL